MPAILAAQYKTIYARYPKAPCFKFPTEKEKCLFLKLFLP